VNGDTEIAFWVAGKFLIDLTDSRFVIGENADVIDFIRRVNPFAHSDVGSALFDLGKEIPGAHAYCPVPSVYSYVVLHTAENRIFAIAFGMSALAFRLATRDEAAALSDGGVHAAEIGAGWTRFEPWGREPKAVTHARLLRWCSRACELAGGVVS
jgi:hypothetical protein